MAILIKQFSDQAAYLLENFSKEEPTVLTWSERMRHPDLAI